MGVSPKDPPPPGRLNLTAGAGPVAVRKSAWLDETLKDIPDEDKRLRNAIKQDFKSVLVPYLGGFVLYGIGAVLASLVVVAAVPVFHSLIAIPVVLALALFAGLAGGVHTFVSGPNRLNYFRIWQNNIQLQILELRLCEAQIRNGNEDDKRDAWQRLVTVADAIQKAIDTIGKQTIASQKFKNLTNGEQVLIANASKVAGEAEQKIRGLLAELDPDLSHHPALAYGEALSQANALQATDIHTERLLDQ